MKTCVKSCVALVGLALLGGSATLSAQDGKNKLPDDVVALLTKNEFELISLAPNEEKDKDGFHNYKVLVKMLVKTDEDRKTIVEALVKGMEGKIVAARCFIPRHGIRATKDGKTVDLVICFECSQMHLYQGDAKAVHLLIGPGPQAVLNKMLKEIQIPKGR